MPLQSLRCWLVVWLCYGAVLQSANAQSAGTAVALTAGATEGAAACTLNITGFGNRPGIKSAQLSCTGGSITAAAHKVLQDFWGPNKTLAGVEWGDEDCSVHAGCLLSVCGGSNAVFDAATVTALKGTPGEAEPWWLAVCFNGSSTVTFSDSSFTFLRNATPLVLANDASVALERCTIRGNTFSASTNYNSSGGIEVWHRASLTVAASTFADNTGAGPTAGAIVAFGTAQAIIRDSGFHTNTAAKGAAVCASSNATITIRSCTFQNNSAFERGGAVFATGHAVVKVLADIPGAPKTTFTENKASSNSGTGCGGDICVEGGAFTSINQALFSGSSAPVGGSLCVYGKGYLTVNNSVLSDAEATNGDGGCIEAEDDSRLDVAHTAMSGCLSDVCGGAIAARQQANVRMLNITVRNPIAAQGGALCLKSESFIVVADSTVTGGRAGQETGGCVHAQGKSAIWLTSVLVSGCSAQLSGGGINVIENGELRLANSTVRNNTAGQGGRLSANQKVGVHGGGVAMWDRSYLRTEGSEIFYNHAQYAGGGLHLNDGTGLHYQMLQDSKVAPTLIYNNTAGTVAGGMRVASGESQTTLARYFHVHDNKAPSSPDIGVTAKSITVVRSNGDSLLASDNRDGFLQVTLNVTDGKDLPSDDDLVYTVYDSSNTALFSNTAQSSQRRSTQEQNGRLRDVSISFKQPTGTYLVAFVNAFWSECECAKANLTVNVVGCPKGHVTGGRDDTCNRCPMGLYSFAPGATQCSVCSANTECPGGATVWPTTGFWHSAPQSIRMHRCFNADACIGGEAAAAAAQNHTAVVANKTAARRLLSVTADGAYKSAQCSEAYEGNLCGQCKPGYGKVRPFLCRRCMKTSTIVLLYVTAVVVMTGLVKLLVRLSTSADLATRTDLQTPTPAELLRALVVHAQWLYIISMMVGVPWPASLAWPLQVVGGIWSSTSGSSIGFDCILKGSKAAPVAVQKLLICLLTPAGVLCGVLLIEAGMHYLRPARSKRAGHDLVSVVMCIVLLFLPTWVNTALSLFTCVGLDTPVDPPYEAHAVGSWWVEDMSQLCYSRTSYHRVWALALGIPITLLFCVALPAGVFLFMWYSRKQGKLGDLEFQQHYGFMYRQWKDRCCWWESVALLQTIALVIVSTFGFALGGYYQCLLSTTVLSVVHMLLLAVKPYKCPAAGRVAVLSVYALFFTTLAALSFIPSNNITPGPIYSNIMGAFILLANVAFLLSTTWKLVRVVDWAAIKQALRKPACFRGTADTHLSPAGDGLPRFPPEQKDATVLPQ